MNIIGGILFISLWHWVKGLHPSLEGINDYVFFIIFPFSNVAALFLVGCALMAWWSTLLLVLILISLVVLSIKFNVFWEEVMVRLLPFTVVGAFCGLR